MGSPAQNYIMFNNRKRKEKRRTRKGSQVGVAVERGTVRMAKLPGSSEITELIEDPACGQKHHNLKPIKKYCIEDDINKLFETMRLGIPIGV
ncbi:hypothetical protein RND71_013282 [Anisodus tanguticus]|uniref:Uncharacterized protein n=1 Tax=Anisodus tanguticus TaxID=243964 RepID=A0AAE1VRD9_9SOLA|nr:hypothetical protein RND71_013282 [Anisodus tanguticus]